MTYAIENIDGSFKERILTTGNIEWDNTHFCPASALTPEERAMFRVVDFREVPPSPPGRWQGVREVDPVKIDGSWTQQWEVYDLPLPLDDKRAQIKRQADDLARMKRDQVVAGISPAEMASWPIKRAEALAYQQSGSATSAPNLSTEAQARSVSIDTLVEKVMDKAALFSALEAQIAGRCGAIQDAAAAAQSEAELLSIDLESGWPV